MAADYTRNIVFNVNDKAIKRATDRITRSLTNIEKTLQRIERKGFNNLAKSAETASKQITNTNKNVAIAQKRIQLLGNAGREIGGIYQKSFGKVFSTFDKLLPIVSETKETIRVLSRNAKRDIDLITFATKASGQGISKLVELFKQGQVSAMTFVTGVSAIISKTKEFGSVAITNLTTLGRLIEQNTKKAGTLVNVLGFKTGIISQPLNLFQNTQAAFERNTLLARQNAMRGNVGRNIGRSQAARRDSDFLGFSQDADFAIRTSGQSRRITSAMMQSFSRPLGADGSPFIGPLFDKNTFVSRVGRPAGFIGPDRPGIQDPVAKSIRRNQAKRDKLLEKELRIRQNILKVEQQSLAVSKTELQTTSGNAQGFIGPRLPRGFRLKQQFAPGGAFFNNRGRSGRIAGAAQSALIGGGFPLLFGQGGLGAAAGGIGGAIGGALSPGLGFGLSIAGTAIAQRIQEGRDFQKQVDQLNKSIRLTGGESEFSVASIKKLGKELGLTKQEALQAANSFEAFGAAARINLIKTFGDDATFNTLKNLRKTVDVLNNIDFIEKKIGKRRADQVVDIVLAAGGLEAQKFILEEMFKLQMDEAKKGNLKGMNKFRATLSSMGQFLLGAGGKKNVFIAGLQQDMIDQTASAQAAAMRKLNEERRRLEARELVRQISEPKEELRELMDPLKQLISLSRSLGDSFSESFRGIVSGSMTAQEALRNLFQRTANHFLDMAAQMIAKQIQMQILGIGLKFFTSGLAPSRGANRGGTDLFGRDFDDPSFGMPRGQSVENFANGGRPPVGRPSIVGEKGPELFVPDRAGTIIPNNQLSGMGGSTSIVINVDASGSSVEGDEEQANQFGSAIATAIQSELIKQKRPGGLLA